jgi:hypothetical protein
LHLQYAGYAQFLSLKVFFSFSIMNKHPLLETLFELHKKEHYVDKMLSTFHYVFVAHKLYNVKHTPIDQ